MLRAGVGGLAGGAVWKAVTVRRCKGRFEHACSQEGATALAVAASSGRQDTVELLLDRGADVEAKNEVSRAMLLFWHAWHCGHEGSSFRTSDEDGGQDFSRQGLFAVRPAHFDKACRFGVTLNWLGLSNSQAGKVTLDFCAANACASVLQGAERIQRWHRRRILAMWARSAR